jgi:putative glutamine amidotransferase
MNRKLKIGITSCKKYSNYEQWFLDAPEGVEVVHLSSSQNNAAAVQQCDGIVLSGGEDIHPERYKRPELMEHLDADNINPVRDAFEWQVIEKGIKLKKPLLGICRGLQLMNVYLGGSLVYDIPAVKKLYGHGSKNKLDSRHAIHVKPGSLLHSITENVSGEINSAHHQSVENFSDELIITATSDPGIVEAIEWKTPLGKPWLLLVQWHPERMHDQENPFAADIRKAFLKEVFANVQK